MAIQIRKRGGKRPGAGRKKGVRDKATGEQRASLEVLARDYTELALETLARIARDSESDAASVSAATALLDRGYGKPRQAVELTGKDGGAIEHSVVSDAERFTSAVAGLAAREGTGEEAGGTKH